jgi:hypothetical protein
MASVEAVAREVVASLGDDTDYLLVVRWLNDRYRQLVGRVKFRQLRQVGELVVPAKVSSGTVTATRDSVTVTPNATAQAAMVAAGIAAPGAPTSHEFWYLRVATAWYKISSIAAGAATITLASTFSEDTATASTYCIIKRHHQLATACRWIGQFYQDRLGRALAGPSPIEVLNSYSPDRTLVGTYPAMVAQVGVSTAGIPIVEIYPYPDESELFHYVYWSLPTDLSISGDIPNLIEPYVLKEGAFIDCYRHKMALAAKANQVEQAGFWSNHMRQQETRWEGIVQQAAMHDQGADDITIILDTLSGFYPAERDIRTARDSWLASYSRPT